MHPTRYFTKYSGAAMTEVSEKGGGDSGIRNWEISQDPEHGFNHFPETDRRRTCSSRFIFIFPPTIQDYRSLCITRCNFGK